MAGCVEQVLSWIAAGEKGRYFVCANPHSLAIARKDRVYRAALCTADLITPDGTGIVLASRLLGGSIRARITGSDIFRELNVALNREGQRSCFFLGAGEETLLRIKDRMALEFPNIMVAGTCSPPFKEEFSDEETRLMIDEINRVMPDVLWVGMTAPKQEKWIYQNKDKLNVKFIGAVGAVFDFFSGNIRRSEYPWSPGARPGMAAAPPPGAAKTVAVDLHLRAGVSVAGAHATAKG
jgi:N-acetylglucosaminyldiphosphoundecaprenol N-acetyl-beta-D-mannosaminyltransferase